MRDKRRSHSGDGEGERGSASSSRSESGLRGERPGGVKTADGLVLAARRYLDYKPRPGGLTDFGRRAGYNGHEIPWSGAFVDCAARDAGVVIPACVYAPSGLAEFIFSRRWRSEPRPGDIAFFNFATKQTDPFGMPHVGIVTDVSEWRRLERFKSIEGQVDGTVKIVTRGKFETIGFGRPDFKARPGRRNLQTGPVFVSPSNVRPGSRGADVLNVQLALTRLVDLKNHSPAVFDRETQRAFARWQRLIGFVGSDASGVPNIPSLERLGEISGIFSIRPLAEN